MALVTAAPLDALQTDVDEVPEVLAGFLEHRWDDVATIAAAIGRDVRWVLTVARGSSDNASRYGGYLLGVDRGLPVMPASPSLFTRYGTPPRLDGAVIVAVSASGRSRDVVSVVEEARRQGRPTVAVTNDPDSPVASAAAHVLPLDAGPERGPTATKTYVASLAAYAALTAALSGQPELRSELATVPEAIASTLGELDGIPGAAAALAAARRVSVVGRGFNLATANELALKLSAITATAAIPYSAADLLRGPAPLAQRSPVVLLATSGRVLSDVVDLLPQLREHGVPTVVLSDVPEVLAEADHPVELPTGIREWLSPLTAIVPAQRLAIAVARQQAELGQA